MSGLLSSARDLARLLDEVADVDWRHPAWWGLVGGTILLEKLAAFAPPRAANGDLYATYLAANGGHRSDTFMGRPLPARRAPIRGAISRARAALDALARHDGQFPGQPLMRSLRWCDGWLERATVTPRVAFITPHAVALAELPPADSPDARTLETALTDFVQTRGRSLAHTLTAPRPGEPTPAPVAVAIGPVPRATARHLHRRAWTAHGGPWLGLGETDDLELVTTCHLGVDGYGHGLISKTVFETLDRAAAESLPVAPGAAPLDPFAPFPGAEPLGVAHAVLSSADGTFARAAYAIGRTAERVYRRDVPPAPRRSARYAPTFQVPVAPGAHGSDADRRRRRVLFALVALRMQDGEFESFPAFRARLDELVARESNAEGLLTRILAATSRAPLPPAARRRLLTSRGDAPIYLPPVEVLAGRTSLSSLRYPLGERCAPPLLAVSSSALHDSVVLTLVHHDDGCTATVSGGGRAATDAGAQAFLDAWRAELAEIR